MRSLASSRPLILFRKQGGLLEREREVKSTYRHFQATSMDIVDAR